MKKYLAFLVLIVCLSILAKSSFAEDQLLQQNNLIYQGAFRVPFSGTGPCSGSGGHMIAYNPTGNSGAGSLFIISGPGGPTTGCSQFAEITIPNPICLDASGRATSCTNYTILSSALVNNVSNLNAASLLQNFVDDTYGNQEKVGGSSTSNVLNTGILVYNGKLIASTKIYYDANLSQQYTHFTNSTNLSINNFSGYYKIDSGVLSGFNSGAMCLIPLGYRAQLGGPVITGQSPGTGIVTSLSYGPCAIVFDPDNLVPANLPPAAVPATPLSYYTESHHLPGGYWGASQQSNIYTSPSDQINGVVFPDNTRSVLFFGSHGLSSTTGYACYGAGTTNPNESCAASYVTTWGPKCVANVSTCNGAIMSSGEVDNDGCCYDPQNSSKGPHSYPYVNYVWAYDAGDSSGNNSPGNRVSSLNSANPGKNNYTAVKLGLIKPYEILPYATWTFTLPTIGELSGVKYGNFSGAAWDPTHQVIYVTQPGADCDGNGCFPLVHVYKVTTSLQPQQPSPPPPGGVRLINP